MNALANLGFWSRQFWIRPTGVTSSTSDALSTTMASASSTWSENTATGVQVSTTSAAMSAPLPIAISTTPAEPTSTQTMAPSPETTSTTNFTAIGASVGAAVGAALVFCGAFFLWKRRTLSSSHGKETDMSSNELHTLQTRDAKIPYVSHYPVFEAPGALHAEPQELPGRPM